MLRKPKKIRSKKITQFAKGQPCTLRVADRCASRETVVFCHAPSRDKATSSKSDDFWGAFGCYNCHLVDEKREIKPEDWLRAIFETQKILFNEGLIEVK